jgi:hypothetical protein
MKRSLPPIDRPINRGKGINIMMKMKYGLFVRSQFPDNDDMMARFDELMAQARLTKNLDFPVS